ncbi:Hsp70 family protein [Humitalea sp. 24SJ18S-53]|uniref:Hsp70 family protein n=1 Tax=Humitalea sp. 24SJ18S-53 TaxID=3422307 RepID=UPI003D664B31
MSNTATIGIDFGTTNSVVAMLDAERRVFRSVLCFRHDPATRRTEHFSGPAAIDAYLDDAHDARLIMSMKSYLAQRSFSETRIHGKPWTLPALIATFLRDLLAEHDIGDARIVVGRPVRFAGEMVDDDFGEARLRDSFAEAGMPDIQIALEPAAAGQRFAAGLDRPATVMVGDFGGGTSDFSLLRFDPGPPARVTPLGHAGVGLAGDALDYRIIDHVVSPHLGKGDTYKVMGTSLPVPPNWYVAFARWHRLALMRSPRIMRDIADVTRTAQHPEKLDRLVRFIEDEAGYALYRTVSGVKAALSSAETATLAFRHADLVIDTPVARADFEAWIAPEITAMDAAVGAALGDAGLEASAVDRVFLTGGTSLVPAVRNIFARRFGADRITGGGEFVSVAEGLAMMPPP